MLSKDEAVLRGGGGGGYVGVCDGSGGSTTVRVLRKRLSYYCIYNCTKSLPLHF